MNQDSPNLESNTSLQWIDQLFREQGRFIESIIRFAVKDHQERDDVYQEVFMALLKVSDPQIQDIRDYLYVLTLNKINEHKHKQFRVRQVLKGYADSLAHTCPSETSDPASIREEAGKMLDLVEARLSKKEAEAVLLRYRDKADTEQAAKTMKISKQSFARYVSIGVKKIRAIVRSSEQTDV